MSMVVTFGRRLAPGCLLATVVAAAAAIGESLLARAGGPSTSAVVLALLIGMTLHGPSRRPDFGPGLTFAVKRLLRVAIALLGLRIAISDIVALGAGTAALVVLSMAATLVAGFGFARLLGRSAAYGALAGGATAVCGASAALAVSTVLPQGRQTEADTAFTVLVANALATVAMITYPLLGLVLGLDERATGVLIGAAVHDVAQVVGAGYAVSEQTGNAATVVKLFRVLLLLPVVLIIGVAFAARGGEAGRARVPVPVFALVFLALVGANSLGLVPDAVRAFGLEASRWGLLIAIGALGLNTSVWAMVALGWRHVAVMTAVSLLLLVIVAGPLALGWV